MKAICPISGVPFRTYDSLTLKLAVEHPIFSIPFEQLVLLLEDIRIQEEEQLKSMNKDSVETQNALANFATVQDLTTPVVEAIHEKNWRNPAFRLYQTKHLVMLALMKQAALLENETGYVARPAPSIISAYFWQASELFTWANTLRNPALIERLPKYKVSKENEDMGNLPNYLDILSEVKDKIGARYRSLAEENKLAAWQKAITIMARRKEIMKKEITTGNNTIVAKWALAVTRAPKDIYDFWYGILTSSSVKITFDGVKVGEQWQAVTAGDLRELRDHLEDNLIGPRGEVETSRKKQTHEDDSEYYFMARHVVLEIVRKHIAILEQGTSAYRIINIAMGDDIITANDDVLEQKAIEAGLPARPNFAYFKNKVEYIRAIAGWRGTIKNLLLELAEQKDKESQQSQGKDDSNYEIL